LRRTTVCLGPQSSFGLPTEGKARWCAGCAKAHGEAVDVVGECEGCDG
jgi:hypothetical protein